jgi:hypothetical protein
MQLALALYALRQGASNISPSYQAPIWLHATPADSPANPTAYLMI